MERRATGCEFYDPSMADDKPEEMSKVCLVLRRTVLGWDLGLGPFHQCLHDDSRSFPCQSVPTASHFSSQLHKTTQALGSHQLWALLVLTVLWHSFSLASFLFDVSRVPDSLSPLSRSVLSSTPVMHCTYTTGIPI